MLFNYVESNLILKRKVCLDVEDNNRNNYNNKFTIKYFIFDIKNGIFLYKKNNLSAKIKNIFYKNDLFSYSHVLPRFDYKIFEDELDNKNYFGFKIRTNQRDFVLFTDQEDEYRKWMIACKTFFGGSQRIVYDIYIPIPNGTAEVTPIQKVSIIQGNGTNSTTVTNIQGTINSEHLDMEIDESFCNFPIKNKKKITKKMSGPKTIHQPFVVINNDNHLKFNSTVKICNTNTTHITDKMNHQGGIELNDFKKK